MATKDQERKALEQIMEIIEKVGGADSYIGKAFECCINDAESNIANDFWNSMAERYQRTLKEALDKGDKIKKLQQELDEANEDAQEWKKRYDRLNEKATEYANKATEHWNNFREQEDKADALELENMKLKAKLYDMMVVA